MSNVQKIVDQIKQSTDYQINKRLLKEKIVTDLHLPYNNGLFLVKPELIAFLATWPDEKLYLEDVYENPIELNRDEFLYHCRLHYQTLMNKWHQQHEELKRIRKI